MPRLFIAIDLPEQIREDIGALFCAIKGTRWIEDAQLHLTLKFIGEVDPPTENLIIEALGNISVPPFSLSLKGVGFFPPRKEPRILWIGIPENQPLLRLQNQIERTLESIKIEPDPRKFHPHITIARLDGAHREKIAQFISENNLFSTDEFEISEFHLYRSYLGKAGAQHVKIATCKLHE